MPKLFSAAFIFSKTRLAAVFTVEAALLMALILPVLLSLIYLGFLDHDRGVLQGAACEAASLADNSAPDKARADKLRTLTEEIGKDAILVSRSLESSFSLSKDFVQVSYTGSMKVPGLLPRLFGRETLPTGRTFSRKLFSPTPAIRKIRGMRYLSSRLNGKEDTS